MNRKQWLANAILQLTYSELMDIGAELSAMKDPKLRPEIETPAEYARLLNDWAESYPNEN